MALSAVLTHMIAPQPRPVVSARPNTATAVTAAGSRVRGQRQRLGRAAQPLLRIQAAGGDTPAGREPVPGQPNSSSEQGSSQPQDADLQQGPAASQEAAQDSSAQQPAAAAEGSSSPVPDAAASGISSSSLGPSGQSSGVGAAAVGGGGGGGGPSAVTLLTRFNGVGYTFVLAGFLKVLTIGGLSLSAPTDVARTAFGKATPYLMVPVGLGMCWVAKQIVDSGLNESKRFLQYLAAALVLLYFGLVKLMYKYEPQTDWVRRPRPRMPGQMAELRAQLGDRELLAAGGMDSARYYQAEKPGSRELYDDVAWYEGRYPSQLAPAGEQQKRGAARRAALAVTDTDEEYTTAANPDYGRHGRTEASSIRAPAGRRSFLSDNPR